ncbi:MAG: hypothetical protein HRT67_09575 [Flavobacteriaceae bacterium]|nr:hypothetical protein [Flavobacteriaceae bacterium]
MALIMGVFFYVLVFEEHQAFNYTILLPFAICVFGALSAVFHLKTFGFYKTKTLNYLNYEKDKVF